jgi:hypothetical protein
MPRLGAVETDTDEADAGTGANDGPVGEYSAANLGGAAYEPDYYQQNNRVDRLSNEVSSKRCTSSEVNVP